MYYLLTGVLDDIFEIDLENEFKKYLHTYYLSLTGTDYLEYCVDQDGGYIFAVVQCNNSRRFFVFSPLATCFIFNIDNKCYCCLEWLFLCFLFAYFNLMEVKVAERVTYPEAYSAIEFKNSSECTFHVYEIPGLDLSLILLPQFKDLSEIYTEVLDNFMKIRHIVFNGVGQK